MTNDTLYGEYGDDRLEGGAGNDILQGGEGVDTYLLANGSRRDFISDTQASDTEKNHLSFQDSAAEDL